MTVSPALLSVIAFVALNSILFAFYLGKLSSRVDRNAERVASQEVRVAKAEATLDQLTRDDMRMGWRIDGLDELKAEMKEVRDALNRSSSSAETERSNMQGRLEKIELALQGINRQIANGMMTRVTQLETIHPPS